MFALLVRLAAVRVADLQQPDLAEVDAREGVADERVQPGLVDLDVEDAAAARGHRHGLAPVWYCVVSWSTQARSKIVPRDVREHGRRTLSTSPSCSGGSSAG